MVGLGTVWISRFIFHIFIAQSDEDEIVNPMKTVTEKIKSKCKQEFKLYEVLYTNQYTCIRNIEMCRRAADRESVQSQGTTARSGTSTT